MKKIYILLFWIILFIILGLYTSKAQYAVQTSLDPHANNFCLYYNDKVNIQSTTGTNYLYLLGKDPLYSTEIDAYIKFNKCEYMIWLVREKILFTVSTDNNTYLGDHLVLFIRTINYYHQIKKS